MFKYMNQCPFPLWEGVGMKFFRGSKGGGMKLFNIMDGTTKRGENEPGEGEEE